MTSRGGGDRGLGHWLGIALRPEYVRRSVYDSSTETSRIVTSGRVYAGVELAWYPASF